MTGKVLVLGATGAVGRYLVTELVQRGQAVRAATRDPASAARRGSNASEASEYVRLDLEQPETFAPALDGIDRVFLIARPGDEHADRVAIPLINEMKRREIRHVVNLTAMGTEQRDDFALRKVEKYLEHSGLGFTHLRPNWFMQIFCGGPLFAQIRATGAIHIPAGKARISYIDVRDIAAVAAAALTEPGHAGKAYTLTGPAALDHDEVMHLISGAAGRTVRYDAISEDGARNGLAAAGFSGERIERLIGFYRLVRQGLCEPVSPDVQTVLGRPAISFAQFARDSAACWE